MDSKSCSPVPSPGGRLSPEVTHGEIGGHRRAGVSSSPTQLPSPCGPPGSSDVSSSADSASIDVSASDTLGRGSHATSVTAFSQGKSPIPFVSDVEANIDTLQNTSCPHPQNHPDTGPSRHEPEGRASPVDRASLSDPAPTLDTFLDSVMPDTGVVSRHPTPFNVFRALYMLSTRPNPQITLDAIHMSQAFAVTDAWQPDQKMMFVSQGFLSLTGYERHELLGLNCRMLQSPHGVVEAGAPRRFISSASAYFLKEKLRMNEEFQYVITNYKKTGDAFTNLLTIIPIAWDTPETRFIFGFATDLSSSPNPVSYGTDPTTMHRMTSHLNLSQRRLVLPGLQAPTPTPKIGHGDVEVGVNDADVDCGEAGTNCDEVAVESDEPGVNLGGLGVDCEESGMDCDEDEAVPSLPSCDVASHQPPTCSTGQDDDVEMAPVDITSEQLAQLARGLEINKDGPSTNAWNRMLLENIDGLVQIVSLKGTIVYISGSCRRLGYVPADLVGQAIERICHPSDRAGLMRELKSPSEEGSIDVLVRLQAKDGGYSWYQNTGSVWSEGARRWAVLVGYQQPVVSLGRDAIGPGYGGATGERDIWFKVSTSGLILHAFPSPQMTLGTPLAALLGSSFLNLVPDGLDHPAFRQLLADGRRHTSTTTTLRLLSPRGHSLRASTTVHPPALHTNTSPHSNDAENPPHFLLLQCRVSRDPPPPRSRKRSLSSSQGLLGHATQRPPQPSSGAPGNNVLQELEADECGVLQYDVRRLISANEALESEVQDLTKRSRQRKKLRAMGAGFQGCANCRTRKTPEWRRGPSGQQDLCNSCGLRYAKSVR